MSVSEAESHVMEVLWRSSPATAADIIEALSKTQDWNEATVRTLLFRLVKKGAVSTERDGRKYLYSPMITRDAFILDETKGVMDRFFGGEVAPFVSYFSRQKKLTKKDVKELRKLIAGLEDGD